MNIGEANDYFLLVRAVAGGFEISEAKHEDVLAAVERLTERANKALSAGPSPTEVRQWVDDTLWLIDEASEDVGGLMTFPRPIETAQPVGGVL